MTTAAHPTAPVDQLAMEDVLSWLLALQSTQQLPRWTGVNCHEGHTCITVRVAGYHEVRAWAAALGDVGEPDRHTAHSDSIVYYTAHFPQIHDQWSVEVTARVRMPIAAALNDDTLDALELLPPDLGVVREQETAGV